MDQLQFEILQCIIELCSQDQRTLYNLSLVCHTLNEISSPHLYHTPQFTTFRQFELFEQNLSATHEKHVRIIDLQLVPHRWNIDIGPTLVSLTSKASSIEHLDLSMCLLDGHHLITAAVTLPSLRYLSVHRCPRQVGDNEIQTIARQCPGLQELDLASSHISDASIRTVAKYCQNLEILDISDCGLVTEDGLRFLAEHCRRLHYVNIKDCYNVLAGTEEFDELFDNVEWLSNDDDEYDTESEADL